ncbi:winged helix-turn-helix transcriptional regulator [Sulfurospirillum barnesii]|uniref:Putative transcriptional regulator n=1 Tax=Sulfurospirillum barnesii (strain ATCC 700032 / DSM 10660 / SES-3) TaxID=760154 RepID=I3XX13_SULBS|nr:helix-turn-helix domain-containing protein [Sulfurospirillum barnesii]AFL68487.1 putative transcriptional regulator [Sulfurospirillum barnesii SES-3]
MYYVNGKEYICSVSIVQDIFNDKWKLGIIWHLLEGEKRYKELFEEVSEITQKTLTIKLRDLEEKHLIKRVVFPEIPPKVVYSLTPIGEKLRPVLKEMFEWGILYVKECGEVTKMNACEVKFSN